jgi:hypothetical protein
MFIAGSLVHDLKINKKKQCKNQNQFVAIVLPSQ